MYRAVIFTKLFPQEHFDKSKFTTIKLMHQQGETPESAMRKVVEFYNPGAVRLATWQVSTGLLFVNNEVCGTVSKIEERPL